MDSIRHHLQVMLNTRHGNAMTVPEYGTSDFSDYFRSFTTMQVIQDEILRSIEVYEPRLTDVEVSFVPDEENPFAMHFDIEASVVTEDSETPTVFRTTVEGTGKVMVRRG